MRLLTAALGMAVGLALPGDAGAAGGDFAAVPMRVVNRAAVPIRCEAAIAHWYSASIGRADPGRAIEAQLWSEPGSGAVYLLNAAGERMPVQTLWCGVDGRSYETRYAVPLQRRRGEAEAAIDLTCRLATGGGALDCRKERVD